MVTSSLCFKEAHEGRLSGEISLEESLSHVVAHYGTSRHETDQDGRRPYFPRGFETEVRDLVLSTSVPPLGKEGVAVLYSIFLGAFTGDISSVRRCIRSFDRNSQYYIRPLMEIARTTSNPDLLRICFENGFLATDWLDCQNLLGNRVISNPSTAWLDVLFDFDFMRWRTDPQQLSGLYQWWCIVDMGPDCTRWWIEHGGHVTRARGLLEFKKTVPDPGTMQILLDRFGIDWFKDSGILQTAAKDDEMESVKMLVDAGADINEYPTDWQSDIREHRAAPLSALQEAMYAKSERMIRYLVEHGATMTLKQLLIPDTFNTLPKEVRDYRDLIVELGGIREENTH